MSNNRTKTTEQIAVMPQPHIVLMVTAPQSTIFFRGQIARLRDAGFRVTFISSPGPQAAAIEREGGEFIGVPMERDISIFNDVVSLWRLFQILRRIRPDLTNVGTPKAGLLGGIAAMMAGVPKRIYTLHGLRLETAAGFLRQVLKLMERLACGTATNVRCVSPSVLDRAVQLKLVSKDKAYVVGRGSSNGVDCELFSTTWQRVEEARQLREQLGIPVYAPVIGFVGRFTRDKGIAELYGAFIRLKAAFPDLRLLLVGDFEAGDPVDAAVRAGLEANPNVVFAGMVKDTPRYYAAMDVLALPTYREGFPNVPLEAQASSVPVVTTRVTGAADSVLDGITGLLVPAQDEAALAEALTELLGNRDRMRYMGRVARDWVEDRFRREAVWQALVEDYQRVLRKSLTTEDTKEHGGRQKQGTSTGRSTLDPKPTTTQTSSTGQGISTPASEALAGDPGVGVTRPQTESTGEGACATQSSSIQTWVKAAFDRVMAAALLVCLSPVMAVVAALVRMKLGSPVLFRQRRPGKDAKVFELVKFRTMTDARDGEGRLLGDDVRLTRLGRWLRAMSLDELPQLWNVLRGELSLVGPRPLLIEYLERYTPEQARRHEVKPGITGWAQVNGRNAIRWEEKFALDTWYVDHWSLSLDVKILGMTVWRVVRRDGISAAGQATMEEFGGSGDREISD